MYKGYSSLPTGYSGLEYRNSYYKRRMGFSFGLIIIILLSALLLNVEGASTSIPPEQADYNVEVYEQGYILYEDETCHSWVLIPGMCLYNKWILAVLYLLALGYIFLGISLISDLFMGAIEIVASQTTSLRVLDRTTGHYQKLEGMVWNPTVANLSLMALGSSAPEIMLSVIETITHLGRQPGELGPSTIVGSAAFNLLVITAISILSIPTGTTKKISDVGVFAVTTCSSIMAYIWLYVILVVTSSDQIALWEALGTLLLFFILILLSYAADKVNGFKMKEEENEKREPKLTPNDFFHLLTIQKGGTSPGDDASPKWGGSSPGNATERELQPPEENWTQLLRKNTMQEVLKETFNVDSLEEIGEETIHKLVTPVSNKLIPRLAYRMGVGNALAGRKKHFVMKDTDGASRVLGLHHAFCVFGCPKYSVVESEGKVIVDVNRTKYCKTPVFDVGIRTIAAVGGVPAATPNEDFIPIDYILHFTKQEVSKRVVITIIDDEEVEDDEDFDIELYDSATGIGYGAPGSRCTVTIIDDDKPGNLGFQDLMINLCEQPEGAKVKVTRKDGACGKVSVEYETHIMEDNEYPAQPGIDFEHNKGTLIFMAQETVKEINITILPKASLERQEAFKILLFNPTGGADIFRKVVFVEIVTSSEFKSNVKRIEKMMEHARADKAVTWCSQFKRAIMLSARIGEDLEIESISTMEAIFHFVTMGWKVLFALVPPPHYLGGWAAFFISLFMIGGLTALVSEFAGLLGCVMGMSDGVTAITLVALGTSVPDTFASKQAAEQGDDADAAIGNITGSNSVNVFLGLGLPYVIGSLYYTLQGEKYMIPAGSLSFSVMMFLLTSLLCIITLIIRRKVVGGELGGSKLSQWLSALWLLILWIIYIVFVSLKFEHVI